MSKPIVTVAPIHFEDFGGRDFERLVFAYLLRTDNWVQLEWHGQVGGDAGRDICGIRLRDTMPKGEHVCVLCANWQKLTIGKVRKDLAKLEATEWSTADRCIVVTGSTVSANLRDKIKKAVCQKISVCDVWSGYEFEELLRKNSESLLKRFVEGIPFPDAPNEMKQVVNLIEAENDQEILALMAGVFDRPAFYTPFHQESSIPAFKKAITDTIEAIGTGMHRLRDGTIIRQIPSRHQAKTKEVRDGLAACVTVFRTSFISLTTPLSLVLMSSICPSNCSNADLVSVVSLD